MIRIYRPDASGTVTVATSLPPKEDRQIKISNNLSTLVFQGSGENSFKDQFISISKVGDKVFKLDDDCFAGVTGLSAINLPDSLKEIGARAFKGCTGLKTCSTINYNNPQRNFHHIGEEAFMGSGILNVGLDLSATNYATSVGARAFKDCTSLERVKFTSLIKVEESGFEGCSSLKEISFSDKFGSFGEAAFKDCTSLAAVTITKGIGSLSKRMFAGCTSLASFAINDVKGNKSTLTNIGNEVFSGCTSLKDLVVPESINSTDKLGENFLKGSSLTSVTFSGLDDSVFGGGFAPQEDTTAETTAGGGSVYLSQTIAYQTGKWYGPEAGTWENYAEIMKYARDNHIPVFELYCGSQCGRCHDWYKKVKEQADFKTWLASRPYFFFHSMWDGKSDKIDDGLKEIMGVRPDSSRGGPWGGWVWYKGDGTKVWFQKSNFKGGNTIYNGTKYQLGTVEGFTNFCDTIFEYSSASSATPAASAQAQTPAVSHEETRTAIVSGWGITTPCYFISSTGTKYYYDPNVSITTLIQQTEWKVDGYTTDNFKYGVWYKKSEALKRFCDANHIPCFAVVADTTSSACTTFKKNVFNNAEFQKWAAEHKCMFCFVQEAKGSFGVTGSDSNFLIYKWMGLKNDNKIPHMMWYWNKPNGKIVKKCEKFNANNTASKAISNIKTKCDKNFKDYSTNASFNLPVSITAEGMFRRYDNQEGDPNGIYFICDTKAVCTPGVRATVTAKNSSGSLVTETFEVYTDTDGSTKFKVFADDIEQVGPSISDGTYQYFTGSGMKYDVSGYIFKISGGNIAYLYSFSNS